MSRELIKTVKRNKAKYQVSLLSKWKQQGCKGIFLDSFGTEHFPVKKARQMGFIVESLPDYHSSSTSQFAFEQLLMLMREANGTFTMELFDKNFLVVGSRGNMGKKVCKLVRGVGGNVFDFDITNNNHNDKRLLKWLAEAHVIVLCLSSERNKDIFKDRHFRAMENKPYIINPTGRLSLVNVERIADNLFINRISGYACDESIDHFLNEDPRCLFTPHMAWKSKEASERRNKMRKQTIFKIEKQIKAKGQ